MFHETFHIAKIVVIDEDNVLNKDKSPPSLEFSPKEEEEEPRRDVREKIVLTIHGLSGETPPGQVAPTAPLATLSTPPRRRRVEIVPPRLLIASNI